MSSHRGQTRDEIIEAARTLFYRRGYARTSFSDIVNHTGIQRGNIYHYFRTKDDILDAVIRQLASEYRAALSAWDTELPDPKDRLRRFVHMVMSNRENLIRYGCPIGSLNTELGKETTCATRESARQLFDLFRDWLEEQFSKLTDPQQARSLALHLLGRTEGISLMGHVYHDPDYISSEVKMIEKWIDTL
ncbi:TetR family transcriptional regulator [Thiogranum longum]|uniref:TetR family transcriptional regulator n=1 Tax=Thiogranum longum TaxID=1537524 RepID=A0A4R1HCP6_9GAMM|nr:TetR/AcrR family transcriptional regulator [Thiogranum longum]TCK18035.1 TetR family transcriptional regulator [Thiogranum longum]